MHCGSLELNEEAVITPVTPVKYDSCLKKNVKCILRMMQTF